MKEIDYSAFFREYYPLVRAYCIARFEIDGYDADDYASRAFEDLWRSWSGFKSSPPNSVYSWLCKRVKSLFIDEYRKRKREPDISEYNEIIAESFKLLAQNGKGIEINTSGLRQAYGQPFPTLKYVKMFKDLGGEFLSLGSDAHFPEHVGANISDGAKLAYDAGFDRICYFKNKKPQFIELK